MAPPSSITTDDISENVDIPDEFLCPLTLEIMNDPVVSKDGQNFDREAILRWLGKGNDTCPLTRQPLRPSSLVPNHKLRMSIRKWKIDQGMTVDEDTDKNNHSNCYSPCRPARSLLSLGCVMDWATERVQEISEQPEERQQGDLADLLSLYDEVLELTSDSVPSAALSTAITVVNDSNQNESSAIEALVDDELREIKDLYEEVCHINTLAQNSA